MGVSSGHLFGISGGILIGFPDRGVSNRGSPVPGRFGRVGSLELV